MRRAAQSTEMPWSIDQSIHVDKVSMDELKLIFGQAEKRLDDTVRQGESIASKTMSMITLMSGLLIGLSGYIISVWKSPSFLTNKDLVGIFGCLYILGILIYVVRNLMTYKYAVAGSKPEKLINGNYFSEDIRRDKMLLLMYLNEIENYNWRIKHNENLNHRRWHRYRISIFFILGFPFFLVLLYSVLKWIHRGE